MRVSFRPMTVWPHPATPTWHRRGPLTFRSPWSATLELLERELAFLRASNVIVGAGFREADIRLDGWPKADARTPPFPGVELSFDHPDHGRLVYATDVCMRWDHNLRSIALGLEALRAVDRYGITRRGEQYAGWKALGPGVQARTMTISDAWDTLYAAAGEARPNDAESSADLEALWRRAARAAHPDAGGDAETFVQAKAAHEFLQKVGGTTSV